MSDILRDISEADETPATVRQTIRRGINPHRHCNCPDCMRAYLRSVEGKGEPA